MAWMIEIFWIEHEQCAVSSTVKKPDVVFLQEVVPQTLPIFQSKCPGLVEIL